MKQPTTKIQTKPAPSRTKKKVLIHSVRTDCWVLLEAPQKVLEAEMERLTAEKEARGEFFVSEERDGDWIVRDFATKTTGYTCSLIICDGVISFE